MPSESIRNLSEEMMRQAEAHRREQDKKLTMSERVEEMLALSSFLAELSAALRQRADEEKR